MGASSNSRALSRSLKRGFGLAAAAVLTLSPSLARADGPYATPPPRVRVDPAYAPDRPIYQEPLEAQPPELRRSPVRFALGPAGMSTGSGLGFGLGVSLDLGTGSIGGRLSAAWMRGEARSDRAPSGDFFAHYLGELTIDLNKRGHFHPIFAVGFGVATVRHSDVGGAAGVGTARLGIEYALGLDDADVRVGMSVLGAMTGPQDRDTRDLRGYGLITSHVAIGF